MNQGESVKSGTSSDFNKSHTFDQSKKITKIVTIVDENETCIMQIKFYSGEEVLCRVGNKDGHWALDDGRVESFEIAADEQLIGAELYNEANIFVGVTWLKMKITN